jgi:hypothetical protein
MWTRVKDATRRDAEDTENPKTWIAMKKSPEWIIKNKKVGLGHLFHAGVRLDDFLKNGYTLDDLCVFQDIGHRGPQRGLLTLQRLGLNPDHLIEYNVQLPIGEMQERFQLTPAKICSRAMNGGLGFHPAEGLRTPRSDHWYLEDVLYLGFTFQDLVACGLWSRDHLEKMGIPNAEQMKLLECTHADIDMLPTGTAPVPKKTPAPQAPVSSLRPQNNNNNNNNNGRKLRILK